MELVNKMTEPLQMLRWIAVLPGAVVAAVLSLFPLHWILYLVLTKFVEVYPETPERVLGPAVLSGIFVWVGSRISPKHKFETSVVLFGLLMFLIGGFVFLAFSDATWNGYHFYFQKSGVSISMAVVGAIVGLFVARAEQSENSDK